MFVVCTFDEVTLIRFFHEVNCEIDYLKLTTSVVIAFINVIKSTGYITTTQPLCRKCMLCVVCVWCVCGVCVVCSVCGVCGV